ncbi:putative restriction endonuclease [Fontibacillus solani]|uniref:Putative restriction endonuclease n=1 Tax=Fontibacillus solani TaxID=1572857 RepID=A0A7W3SQL1_9BACL|nr:HNH endonuclease [Fontibacillus solani]MBA9084322.1 putative restriction endonuclease [Fontibacillus solani]
MISDWIPVPEDWKPSIVQGKTYDTETELGQQLYSEVQSIIQRQFIADSELVTEDSEAKRYGSAQIVFPRIGQGAFKVMVTEAYHRRCAITGEKTLPVLEAAHIKPYSQNGPNVTPNGLLLHYAYHGKKLIEMPQAQQERPSTQFLLWHNENVYLA